MKRANSALLPAALPESTAWMRGASVLGGLACVACILAALALTRAPGEAPPEAEVYVARQVALPLEPPPPLEAPSEVRLPSLVGPIRLEIAASASAVRIQVPDIQLPAGELPPPAARPTVAARFDLARSAMRPPQDNGDLEGRRVFSRNEVDQRPQVLQRVKPRVSYMKVRNMATPRTTMLLVVNTDGTVGDVRLLHSSRDEDFDGIMMDMIREWKFQPAVRKGRKVRCWVEQAVSVRLALGSTFEVY